MKKIIAITDGPTDLHFLCKVFEEDSDLSVLNLHLMPPEDVGLKRRSGGGHRTLLKEAKAAAIRAAQGFADGILVTVDNDGDKRFCFPHEEVCDNCRECEVMTELQSIQWGEPFSREAVCFYQALETLLLSAQGHFTPQMEDSLVGDALKNKVYGEQSGDDFIEAFKEKLELLNVAAIKARSYPRLKTAVQRL